MEKRKQRTFDISVDRGIINTKTRGMHSIGSGKPVTGIYLDLIGSGINVGKGGRNGSAKGVNGSQWIPST